MVHSDPVTISRAPGQSEESWQNLGAKRVGISLRNGIKKEGLMRTHRTIPTVYGTTFHYLRFLRDKWNLFTGGFGRNMTR